MRFLLSLLLVLLSACSGDERPAEQAEISVQVSSRMAALPDPGFKRVIAPRPFVFPADHGPHSEYATEWWYFTGNVKDGNGVRLGYQLTLFRVGLKPGEPGGDSPWRSHQLMMGHLAVSHIGRGEHVSTERFSRAALGLGGARTPPLKVWLGDWQIRGADGGKLFPLQLKARADDIEIDLTLGAPAKPMVLQGDRGFSRKAAGEGNASYYYSYTRLPTQGRIRFDKDVYQVSGNSWFDREWSSSALAADQAGWDWLALQLDDGRDLMFYRMRDFNGQAQSFSNGVLVDQQGEAIKLDLTNTEITPIRYWTNAEGKQYPVAWRLELIEQNLELIVEAAIDDQEMRHTVRYWEGAVNVSGSLDGVGYLEMSGY